MKKFAFVVDEHDEGERIDKYLCKMISDYSKMDIKKNIDKGNLLINNVFVGRPSTVLKVLDKVEINIHDEWDTKAVPEDIEIDILYEDSDLLIVNKPQGMPVHPSPGHHSGTLFNAIVYYINIKSQSSGENIKPGIVHRIDIDTSGILVVSKNSHAHNHLSKQFAAHTINRKYDAIVHNNVVEDIGKIEEPIGRDELDKMKRTVNYLKGKNAITYYKVLKRFEKFTYIECSIDTGRTHQIRVHMAHIGHPLLGDEVYGIAEQPFKLKGQALHARMLGFIHPTTNEYIEFEKEAPEYFKELLEVLDDKCMSHHM